MAWQTPKTDWAAADGVRDSDFNRIEGNILDLYENAMARSVINVYVSIAGDDQIGDGSAPAPYATITKALSSIPKNLNGNSVTLHVGDGAYNEDVDISGYNGTINMDLESEAILSSLLIRNSTVYVAGNYLTVNGDGITVSDNATLRVGADVQITGGFVGIEVLRGGTFVATSYVTLAESSTGIRASEGGRVYAGTIEGTSLTTGIAAITGGSIAYSYLDLDAVTTQHTATGGRIYSGSQTSVPNY